MKYLRFLAILFFDIIDKYIHQKYIIFFFKKRLKKINFFIDVGCHKGTYTDLFNSNYNLKKILMFEPQKEIFPFLKRKYSKFQNIQIFNNAVGDTNKLKRMYINKHDLTSSLKKLDENNFYIKQKKKLFNEKKNQSLIIKNYLIKCITLSKVIKKYKFNRVDLIKIDTEGYEYEVLKGLGNSIFKINYILIEFHNDKIYSDYDSFKIHAFLKKKNFKLKKTFKFPFTAWEDRVYINKKI